MKNLHILFSRDDAFVLNHAFHEANETREDICVEFIQTFDERMHDEIERGDVFEVWCVPCEDADTELFREFAHQSTKHYGKIKPQDLGATLFAAIDAATNEAYQMEQMTADFGTP